MVRQAEYSDELKEIWDGIAEASGSGIPFYTSAWHRAWYEHFPESGTPLALTVNDRVIAPLNRNGPQVTFSGGTEISDYLDIVGPQELKTSAWDELLPFLKALGVTRLEFHNIPESSPTVQFFRDRGAGDMQVTVSREDTTPVVRLPARFDEFLAMRSRHVRHEIRRKLRRFDTAYPGVTFDPGTAEPVPMETVLELMRNNPAKRTFLTDAMSGFFSDIPETVPGMRIESLRDGQRVIAAKIVFPTADGLLLYNSGYDPSYEQAGIAMTARSIEHAISEKRRYYNFLQGSERYKYDFGGADRLVLTVTADI